MREDARSDGSSAERVSSHWGRKASEQQTHPDLEQQIDWLDSPLVQREHVNPATSGQPDLNWLEWSLRHHVPRGATWACTIGCGAGGLERHARASGFEAEFDSFDISMQAIEVAREEARQEGLEGIRYEQADLNECELPTGRYDVVFASQSLHHIERLERLMSGVHRALKPGGLIVFNEYVGPRRFQWSDWQLTLINRFLTWLPERLRLDRVQQGKIKCEVVRPRVEEILSVDPSEAVLSDRILPLAEELFEPLVKRDYGGTILHMLLDRIIGNFREEDVDSIKRLRRVARLETELIAMGALPSDFTFRIYSRS